MVATDFQDCEKFIWSFFPTQEGPLAVVLFSGIFFFNPPNSSCFRFQNKEVFSANDLVFCHAYMVLLSNNFLLLFALRCKESVHHNDLGILPFQLEPKSPAIAVV